MFNFTFQNPTKIIFGQNKIESLHNEIPKRAKVMITFGGGTIKKLGLIDTITKSLCQNDIQIVEFGGIEPNPRFETLMRGIELARKEKIDYLLAVGGGSVIDGTKFMAAAIPFEGETWDIVAKAAPLNKAIPMGTVLTLPATGSEMNCFAVITKGERHKLAFAHPFVFPKFSILDPTVTYSLPPRQIANGVVDAFVHTMEQYLTYPNNASLQDRFSESILQTLIEEGPKTLQNPQDYNARANMMWCTTMALNGLIGVGVPQDWATHKIGHEITALYGLDHAQTLAIVLPALMTVQAEEKSEKIHQYGMRIFGVSTIEEAIKKTTDFFESLGVKTHLKDYGLSEDAILAIIKNLEEHGNVKMGEKGTITLSKVEKILKRAL